MPDITTRINAIIAYLFLGPIILLARRGTPLADPYVQSHAKRASLIILGSLMLTIFYFLIKKYLSFGIFGVSLSTIFIVSIMSITLIFLMIGAYRAYHGYSTQDIGWHGGISISAHSRTLGNYTEEEKIRIIASFIPFLGMLITRGSNQREQCIGRKVGSFFMVLIILTEVFLSGNTSTLVLILTVFFIGLIVSTGVYLIGFSEFLSFRWYGFIPNYREFDAHIKTIFLSFYNLIRIAFGGEKKQSYSDIYRYFLEKNTESKTIETPYFLPNWIIGIPLLNLITFPSFFQSRYREYRFLVLQGICIDILLFLTIWIYGTGTSIGLLLLFPIFSLIIGSTDAHTRAPIVSISVDLWNLGSHGQKKIEEIKQGEERVKYEYESGEKIDNK